jgi:hypothetical protein
VLAADTWARTRARELTAATDQRQEITQA